MKVAIVNDLAVACEALRRAVAQDPALEVAWTAHDGAEAVEKARRQRPDVILMDLIMPRMNGVEATRAIMRAAPCPILVVTATVSGNAGLVYEALGAGALDAVNTPTFAAGARIVGGEELLRRIHLVARAERCGAQDAPSAATASSASNAPNAPNAARAPSASAAHGAAPTPARTAPRAPHSDSRAPHSDTRAPHAATAARAIIAIGASTGGPRAVADVLRALPAPLPAAVLIVQHLSQPFMQGYADWLGAEIGRPVALARAGHLVAAGDTLIAGEERHLTLGPDGRLVYRDEPRAHPHRPSVDELFDSLALHARPGIAVLLTGMGRDGADGLLRLRRAGWHTIAQDERTSVVWGMPGAAHRLGAAVETLPIEFIAGAIKARLRDGGGTD
ncbi:MAG: chemotaxis-specific protein-glutamate methyltransferase CheB [Phycisphaerales bacterium]